ncbi:TPA: hypothetical protein HA235_01165 [Candidatus Woesearchaeota archaeon]|nr:hypothetical protein [Candidatus Woesearchaeota archaeon]HIH31293.1 hypothetical protein [Candidatus Woesearchaeota archaeon]HIH55130.1 hypothetical protein [Candidatus Woesearchaeota archaeon]HIJ01806.1 hypothetical protein [Candidatus Woesearchaeota archaeon]HIJ14435.1 hypothetical protein [Candidatus Woesearchaeota archaeon]
MRDVSHADFVGRWANFVKDNPNKWRKFHNDFINSQIRSSRGFIERLSRQDNGKEKIVKLYSIKNLQGYKRLLRV